MEKEQEIVLFKSLRNFKRRYKGIFTLKSKSNDNVVWGWGATLSCFK